MQITSRRWLLRERTAEAHAAVDAAIGGFHDLPSYGNYLRAIAAFRRPIEDRLNSVAWPEALLDWRPARVSEAIAADLADLGIRPDASRPQQVPLEGDSLFGALYVLEGSALGARLLLARAESIGLSAGFGARHLALLGSNIDGWRGFLARLEQVEPFDLEMALEGSLATFHSARLAFGAT
ncbi:MULTISPECIES: biliverdin-producing heme oxygenase [unclassified Devosia]|uniref:biliverdin-producing heme oxygenase n=1 Tax=unclassified Devosia TaxID=196773 RepID=UPI00086EDBF8|nr:MULTISPECIES: biliverdin-producing heme oxygenase [unclassified Devosia]MBN9363050.1 biliverdin-producing heme oxygenase [Devosia sp.]ODS84510.1 MAG: hypothetical protein ABS47_19040 [Devosia sp. SCN 66-27]OJX23643.1 MAG: hypothetical protein BGO83_00780 [Devosia sp. 66-14]